MSSDRFDFWIHGVNTVIDWHTARILKPISIDSPETKVVTIALSYGKAQILQI